MYEFRPGDPAAKEIIRKLRQDSSRLKNKVKATVTLQLRELTVYDEKVKVSFAGMESGLCDRLFRPLVIGFQCWR